MTKIKSSSVLFGIALGLFSLVYYGCSKDRISTDKTKSLKDYNSVNEYLDTKKQQEQVFIIDTSGKGPIIGNQGTRIWIGKECLMFPNGDSVKWPFEVRLVELYKPKDMLYYQMPTVAAGNILETAGEIRLRAFKNGTELVFKSGCGAKITMPNATPQANHMHVYYGVNSSNYVDWTDNPASAGVTVFGTDSIGYTSFISKLGWINSDFQIGNNTGNTITFTSSTDNLQNVGIFVYFPSTKSLMQVYNMSSGLIPTGSNVKIIGIGIDSNGDLFSFDKTQTVNSNTQFDVSLSPTTDAALTTYLDAL